MSIKNKTLAVMIAAALGVSFGASATGGNHHGGGGYHHGGGGGSECCRGGTDNTNDDGNQAVDDSEIYDIDLDYRSLTKNINKDILNGWDNSVRVRMDTNLNYQKNFTFQGGHTGDTVSASFAGSHSGSQAGNLGLMGQDADNGALGLGVGYGAGLGAAYSEANGGDTSGRFPGNFKRRHGGREDGGSDVDSGDAGGAGYGAGMGKGYGMAKLKAAQNLDQQAASASWSKAYSVSMIKSGDNNIGNTGPTYGINVQQGISGQSALGNQSVNVNSSMQF